MLLQSPLNTVTSMVEADVLRVLARAESEFTVARLSTMIEGRSPEGIRRALERLVDQGVVDRRVVGRAHSYALNRAHLAAPAIIALATLDNELRDRLRARVAEWRVPPTYAAIFGSGARGEMTPESDIDLAFVFEGAVDDHTFDDIVDLAHDVTAWTGNDTRPLVLDSDEIRGRAEAERVLLDIARDGIPFAGEAGDFRELVGA